MFMNLYIVVTPWLSLIGLVSIYTTIRDNIAWRRDTERHIQELLEAARKGNDVADD